MPRRTAPPPLHPLEAAVRSFVLREDLLRDGETVIVAFSGGADSTALLAVLAALARGPGPRVRLVAAHLDHGIRPRSRADAAAARAVAQALHVEWVGGRARIASRPGTSAEAAARRARYAFLARVARRYRAARVAVAHHRRDRAETVLHRVLQGGTLAGLAGIPVRRSLPGAPGTEVVRPLHDQRPEALRAYLAARGLPWRDDPTNAEGHNARARIRGTVWPAVRAAYPDAEAGLLAVERAARDALRASEPSPGEIAATRGTGSLPVAWLRGRPPEAVRRLLRAALAGAGAPHPEPPAAAVRRLTAAAGAEDGRRRLVPVRGGFAVVVAEGIARVVRLPTP